MYNIFNCIQILLVIYYNMMASKKFFYKIPLIQMTLTLLLFLSIGLVFFLLYCNRKSNTYVTFVQDANTIITDEREIYIEFDTPHDKWWPESNGTYGAQFNGKFFNNTNHSFTDWTVKVQVPKGYWVDSNWNFDGEFHYSETKAIPENHSNYPEYENQFEDLEDFIIMKKIPTNMVTVVHPSNVYNHEPFMLGMIMYTPKRFFIRNITITGRFIYEPKDNPLYFILLSAIGISLLSLSVLIIIQITVSRKVKYYELRQKLDSDIIIQSFKTFANFVDARDPYTRGHSLRVAYYAREIATRMNMSEQEQMEMFWFGLMHDVGKIGVSDSILHKPAKLTSDEYDQIKSHVQTGYEMLVDFTAMPMLKEVAKSHHEHWDGSGYCEHLKGQEIPLEARIVCVCDSFDAMNTDRCYRPKMDREKIVEEFKKCSGTFYDPKIAKIMIEMINDRSVDKIESIDTMSDINYKA